MNTFSVFLCVSVLTYTSAFVSNSFSTRLNLGLNAEVKDRVIASIEAPDFYWKYRLERLASIKGGELSFKAENYKGVSGFKDLYDSYYLDLTLSGKLEGFDWEAEKQISESEWLTIYKSISQWSSATAKTSKPDTSNLPENDFDLLKQFYPQLNFRELETPFAVEEVGANFPYKSVKDLLSAASNGKLSVSGYSAATASLEATEAKAALAALKTSTMSKLDALLKDTLSYAQNPFPDDTAKKHYQSLRQKLADFPQGPAEWNAYRAKFDKEVDEMARLASKRVEHGHHGEEEEHEPTPAEEFQAKYGRSLDEMQERFSKYKADPVGFLESSIVEKYGKSGLDVWKKSQEFSEKLALLSEADKTAAESAFSNFLKSA